MFFWIVLASLMGIIMFGTLHEKTKDQEFFVQPVYEALSLNLFQFHNAVVYGYEDALLTDNAATMTYLSQAYRGTPDGVVPLATVEEGEVTDGGVSENNIKDLIVKRLPTAFRAQNGTRSYLFCFDKATGQSNYGLCSSPTAIRYIMTFRAVPPRYDGADKMVALRAIASASVNSRNVGMIEKASEPLPEGGTTLHQPIGAHYFILASGYSTATATYIPDYITCNAPRFNADETKVIGDNIKTTRYLVALSLMQGLDQSENLEAGSNEAMSSGCEALQ